MYSLKERTRGLQLHVVLAVLARLLAQHRAAELLVQHLHAVADACGERRASYYSECKGKASELASRNGNLLF